MRLQDELNSVSAPEDFLPTFKPLTSLDTTLRCPICKDFFVAPVLIHIPKCCHTFCSACIRTCFNQNNHSKIGSAGLGGVGNSQRCPICKTEAHEEKIKPVPVLESVVASWQEARSEILRMIAQVTSLENQLLNATKESRGGGRDVSPYLTKVRGTSKSASPEAPQPGSSKRVNAGRASHTSQNQPSSSTSRTTRSGQKHYRSAAEELQEASRAIPTSKKRKSSERRPSGRELSIDSDIELLAPPDPTNPAAMVSCPICDKLFRNSDMDSHVDKCLTGQSKPTSFLQSNRSQKPLQKSIVPKPSNKSRPISTISEIKIPLPHFPSLKIKDFKVHLSKHDLSLDGSTDSMTRRLNRYILLHNANLDAEPEHRRTLNEIRREVRDWEKLYDADVAKRRKVSTLAPFAIEHGTGKKKVLITSEQEYVRKNQDQFALLTAQAAKGFAKKPLLPPPQEQQCELSKSKDEATDQLQPCDVSNDPNAVDSTSPLPAAASLPSNPLESKIVSSSTETGNQLASPLQTTDLPPLLKSTSPSRHIPGSDVNPNEGLS